MKNTITTLWECLFTDSAWKFDEETTAFAMFLDAIVTEYQDVFIK